MNDKKDIIVFKNNEEKLQLSKFETNILISSKKVLILKSEIIDLPVKHSHILMVNAKRTESSDNKFGIGQIITKASDVDTFQKKDYVLFNKWNNCLEFSSNNRIYYIVKAEDIHAQINVEKHLNNEKEN